MDHHHFVIGQQQGAQGFFAFGPLNQAVADQMVPVLKSLSGLSCLFRIDTGGTIDPHIGTVNGQAPVPPAAPGGPPAGTVAAPPAETVPAATAA